MVLSVVLVATLAISGTVAYLTDDESEVNVMTVGKVDIVLWEQQRELDSEGKAIPDSALENFEDYKNLMPIVYSAQTDPKDKWGMSEAKNYVDKIVRVQNIGASDAYVRIFVGVPAALDNVDDASKNILHWNVGNRFDATGSEKYSSGAAPSDSPYMVEFPDGGKFVCQQTIADENGKELLYNVYCFTRKDALKANAGDASMSAAAFVGFYLDKNVDYNDKDGYYYLGSDKTDITKRITEKGVGQTDETIPAFNFDNGISIPVFAQAIQAEGFGSAAEAFANMTIPWVNAETGEEVEPTGPVYTPAPGAETSTPETPAPGPESGPEMPVMTPEPATSPSVHETTKPVA